MVTMLNGGSPKTFGLGCDDFGEAISSAASSLAVTLELVATCSKMSFKSRRERTKKERNKAANSRKSISLEWVMVVQPSSDDVFDVLGVTWQDRSLQK